MAFAYDNKAWGSSQYDDEAGYFKEGSQIKLSPRSLSASSPRNDPLFTDFPQEANSVSSHPSLYELRDVFGFKAHRDNVNELKAENEIETKSRIRNTEDVKSIKPEFADFIVNSVSNVVPWKEENKVYKSEGDIVKEENKNEVVTTAKVTPTLSTSNILYRQGKPFLSTGKFSYNNSDKVFDGNKEFHSQLLSENVLQHLENCTFCEHVEINRQFAQERNDKNIFSCQFCPRKFPNEISFREHLKQDMNERDTELRQTASTTAFGCEINTTKISDKHGSIEHYECSLCKKSFRWKCSLIYHIRVHTGEKPFSYTNLTENLLSVEQDTSSKFQETVPRLTISKVEDSTKNSSDEAICTKNEVVTRTKMAVLCRPDSFCGQEMLFKCTGKYACKCEKIFSKDRELHHHYVSEDIHHIYNCKFCKLVFSPTIKINRNFSLQKGERIIFTCMHCPKRFTNEYFFKDHLIHCKEEATQYDEGISSNNVQDNLGKMGSSNKCGSRNRYSCYLCGKSFTSKPYLNIHFLTHTGERPFKCHICSKSFQRNFILQCHLKVHTKKKFICSKCNLDFSLQIGLNNHVNRAHKTVPGNVSCEECTMTFSSKQDLQKHLELKRSIDPRYQNTLPTTSGTKATGNLQLETTIQDWPYECGICGKTFGNENSFQFHLRGHSKQKNWKCGDCKKSFGTKHGLDYHRISHTNEKLFNCKYCQKGFLRKQSLITHLKTHMKDKPRKCRICGKGFAQSCDRNIHERRHTGIKPYNCKTCGRNFFTKNKLKSHSFVHSSQPPMFQCDLCTRVLKTKTDLRKHVETVHTKYEEKHSCLICGKTFLRKYYLQSHMKVHNKNRPTFQCDYCEKNFLNNSGLTYHILSHTGEKEFCCDICGSKFSRKFTLKYHILSHLGERSFTCNICQKRFLSKMTLSSHMITHKTERPYKCVECGQSFRQRGCLRGHLMTHMEVTPFFCDLCDKSFSRKTSLKSHMWIKHEIVVK